MGCATFSHTIHKRGDWKSKSAKRGLGREYIKVFYRTFVDDVCTYWSLFFLFAKVFAMVMKQSGGWVDAGPPFAKHARRCEHVFVCFLVMAAGVNRADLNLRHMDQCAST